MGSLKSTKNLSRQERWSAGSTKGVKGEESADYARFAKSAGDVGSTESAGSVRLVICGVAVEKPRTVTTVWTAAGARNTGTCEAQSCTKFLAQNRGNERVFSSGIRVVVERGIAKIRMCWREELRRPAFTSPREHRSAKHGAVRECVIVVDRKREVPSIITEWKRLQCRMVSVQNR